MDTKVCATTAVAVAAAATRTSSSNNVHLVWFNVIHSAEI